MMPSKIQRHSYVEQSRETDKRRAVTLADLIVAILLMSIASAVTVPRMTETLNRYRVEAAALAMAGHLQYIRKNAMISGREVTVTFTSTPAIVSAPTVTLPTRQAAPFRVDYSDMYLVQSISWTGMNGDTFRVDRYGDLYDANGPIQTLTITFEGSKITSQLILSGNDITVEVE